MGSAQLTPFTDIKKLFEHISAAALHNSRERAQEVPETELKNIVREWSSRLHTLPTTISTPSESSPPLSSPFDRLSTDDTLSDIFKWLYDPFTSYSVVWMHENTRTQALLLANALAHLLQQHGLLSASYFFSAASDSASVVPTIAYQLAQNITQAAVPIAQAVGQNLAVFTSRCHDQVEQLILHPLRNASDLCNEFSEAPTHKVIIIHGLENYNDNDNFQASFLDSLTRAVVLLETTHVPQKLLVLGQCTDWLQRCFSNLASQRKIVQRPIQLHNLLEKEHEICRKEKEIEKRDKALADKEKSVNTRVEALRRELRSQEARLDQMEENVKQGREELEKSKQALRCREEEICGREKEVEKREGRLRCREEEICGKEMEVEKREGRLRCREEEICGKEMVVEKREGRLRCREEEICGKEMEMEKCKGHLRCREEEICGREKEVEKREGRLRCREEEICGKEKEIEKRDKAFRSQEAPRNQMEERGKELQKREGALRCREEEICSKEEIEKRDKALRSQEPHPGLSPGSPGSSPPSRGQSGGGRRPSISASGTATGSMDTVWEGAQTTAGSQGSGVGRSSAGVTVPQGGSPRISAEANRSAQDARGKNVGTEQGSWEKKKSLHSTSDSTPASSSNRNQNEGYTATGVTRGVVGRPSSSQDRTTNDGEVPVASKTSRRPSGGESESPAVITPSTSFGSRAPIRDRQPNTPKTTTGSVESLATKASMGNATPGGVVCSNQGRSAPTSGISVGSTVATLGQQEPIRRELALQAEGEEWCWAGRRQQQLEAVGERSRRPSRRPSGGESESPAVITLSTSFGSRAPIRDRQPNPPKTTTGSVESLATKASMGNATPGGVVCSNQGRSAPTSGISVGSTVTTLSQQEPTRRELALQAGREEWCWPRRQQQQLEAVGERSRRPSPRPNGGESESPAVITLSTSFGSSSPIRDRQPNTPKTTTGSVESLATKASMGNATPGGVVCSNQGRSAPTSGISVGSTVTTLSQQEPTRRELALQAEGEEWCWPRRRQQQLEAVGERSRRPSRRPSGGESESPAVITPSTSFGSRAPIRDRQPNTPKTTTGSMESLATKASMGNATPGGVVCSNQGRSAPTSGISVGSTVTTLSQQEPTRQELALQAEGEEWCWAGRQQQLEAVGERSRRPSPRPSGGESESPAVITPSTSFVSRAPIRDRQPNPPKTTTGSVESLATKASMGNATPGGVVCSNQGQSAPTSGISVGSTVATLGQQEPTRQELALQAEREERWPGQRSGRAEPPWG